jgi:hypothetical protein
LPDEETVRLEKRKFLADLLAVKAQMDELQTAAR